MNVYILK